MMQNFKANFPHLALPDDWWFELTDEEREKAESAPPGWKSGILPPDEFRRYLHG